MPPALASRASGLSMIARMSGSVGAKVLLVEDEEPLLRMMRDILSADFTVFGETSAEAGLAVLERERVDAVVADHMLPGMTGLDLLQKTMVLQPHAARLLVTASGRISDAQDAINLGKVKRFLSKPFHPQDLRRAVGEAVHEVALASIREQLVKELKDRNGYLSEALRLVESRGKVMERVLEHRTQELHDLVSTLEGLAVRDGLTGTYHHRYFQEALAAELERARRNRKTTALVMVDVNGFRAFNREHGYSAGDALLRRVVEVLPSPDRDASGEEIAARFAADTFAVILGGADADAARRYCDRVEREVSKAAGSAPPAPWSGATVRTGFAVFPADAGTAEQLVEAARRALGQGPKAPAAAPSPEVSGPRAP